MRQCRRIWIRGLWHPRDAACAEGSSVSQRLPVRRSSGAKRHRQPWTKQWVDTVTHIIGCFRCCHSCCLRHRCRFFPAVSFHRRCDCRVGSWVTPGSNCHSPTYHLAGFLAVIPKVDSSRLSLLLTCRQPGNQADWDALYSSDSWFHELTPGWNW